MPWCRDTLCDSFPSLYALAASKEAWVAEVWDTSGKRVIVDLEDKVLWKETKDGKFSVKSLYGALELRIAVLFPRSIIWSPCVPTKENSLVWLKCPVIGLRPQKYDYHKRCLIP
ncbi:hypothetical protein CK203_087093 [Vitis vinifera]|uniref:Uncharacterized protein n=1 Tax=Vitis vinifera TaxID=29760 RepID=A0A438EAL9_VITVI|nr:hypothetical protein CK203_087093 [Vitis vinifera]